MGLTLFLICATVRICAVTLSMIVYGDQKTIQAQSEADADGNSMHPQP